ncbi:undecaprenyl-diphosphate phosphatase [Streptomyces sp. NBC_00448]|uniref:undecaprenyl-diphosphate phosphatase n=1 Tax=Streptomyces sp. NBC_00448 TaxID=2903652 RepID=UPI002E1E9CE0
MSTSTSTEAVRDRRIATVDQELAWLLIAATVPVGVAGLALDHLFRGVPGKPVPAEVFLALTGLVLYGAELLRRGGTGRRRVGSAPAAGGEDPPPDERSDRRITKLSFGHGALIGAAQIPALMPGISRSGVTIGAGTFRCLPYEDSARFAFLLATPVIGAAALLQVPDLLGPAGGGIRGRVVAGGVAAFAAGYVAVRFLARCFANGTLTPFTVYRGPAGPGGLACPALG